jgi:hypothetical protein
MENKLRWVINLRSTTGDQLAAVFATWATEETFRSQLADQVGDDSGRAVIVGHEAILKLPDRLARIRGSLAAPLSASD